MPCFPNIVVKWKLQLSIRCQDVCRLVQKHCVTIYVCRLVQKHCVTKISTLKALEQRPKLFPSCLRNTWMMWLPREFWLIYHCLETKQDVAKLSFTVKLPFSWRLKLKGILMNGAQLVRRCLWSVQILDIAYEHIHYTLTFCWKSIVETFIQSSDSLKFSHIYAIKVYWTTLHYILKVTLKIISYLDCFTTRNYVVFWTFIDSYKTLN